MDDAYEAVPYLGAVLPWTSPAHLALCASWFGSERPPLDVFRFVELGCGDGGNLLPLAYYHPGASFVGIDSSRGALDRARQAADAIGLRNVRFIEKDVRHLSPDDGDGCQYIVAHGLYSWVSDEAREAILRFCGESLTSTGLAYVSYNAQPGWGIRRVVRESLLRASSVRQARGLDKARRAKDEAARLLEDLPGRDYAWSVLLAEELERVRDGEPFYVFHEYLAEHNEGFWLRDFVDRARRFGLGYLADAQFCRREGRVPAPLWEALARRDLDPATREETADLLGHRYFRASVLCRADAQRQDGARRRLLQEGCFATALAAQSDPFDLTEGVVERFAPPEGEPVALDAAIAKAALVTLAAEWPTGTKLDHLHRRAAELLARHGQGCQTSGDSRAQLTETLAMLFETGHVDLRLSEPSVSDEVDQPSLHALARFELDQGRALSTPHHLPLRPDPEMLAVARALDGSRSPADLRRAFGDQLVHRTLSALRRWGLLANEKVGLQGRRIDYIELR